MKVVFVVQGEGRGHMTQAITMKELLSSNGHEVTKVLVGRSKSRTLPDFFRRSIGAEVKTFYSPNFLPKPDNKRSSVTHSLAYVHNKETPCALCLCVESTPPTTLFKFSGQDDRIVIQ